jgi:hypothetical protein
VGSGAVVTSVVCGGQQDVIEGWHEDDLVAEHLDVVSVWEVALSLQVWFVAGSRT